MPRLKSKIQGKPEQGKTTSLVRVWHAFMFSIDGLRHITQTETAFKQQVLLGLVLIATAAVLAETPGQLVLLVVPILVCWLIEIINTAIEAVADAVSEDFDANIKVAKDLGSLAVLMGFVILACVWAGVLFG